MRLLIDTHALLWWWTDDPQLSTTARSAVADEANEVLVSAASAWEVGTKQRLGKLAACLKRIAPSASSSWPMALSTSP